MKVFLSFCLVVLSLFSYFLFTEMTGIYQYYPVVHYLGMVIGTFLIIRLIVKKFTKTRLVLSILAVFLFFLFLWYTLDYSSYPNNKANITAGIEIDEQFKQITLTSANGGDINLGTAIRQNSATLIVLNRGDW